MIDDRTQEEYFIALYKEMYSSLYKIALSSIHNEDIAQDLVQETFLVAYRRRDALVSSSSPKGWLIKTLRNIIGNTYKQQAKIAEMFTSLEELEDNVGRDTDFPVKLEYRGIIDDESLKLLMWVYCDNWSYQEAADKLGISLSACKKRIQRAKEQFKKAFEEEK